MVRRPVRPKVNGYVLDWISREPIRSQWFCEQRDGNCRLVESFCPLDTDLSCKSCYRTLARDLTPGNRPKCNITSLATYQKISASAFSAMWRGAKCNRTATLLRLRLLLCSRAKAEIPRSGRSSCCRAGRRNRVSGLRLEGPEGLGHHMIAVERASRSVVNANRHTRIISGTDLDLQLRRFCCEAVLCGRRKIAVTC